MNINPFIDLLASILTLYKWLLILWVILSWGISLEIVNRYNVIIQRIMYFTGKLIQPILSYIQRYIPPIAGIDLSVLLLFLLLTFTRSALYTYFYQ